MSPVVALVFHQLCQHFQCFHVFGGDAHVGQQLFAFFGFDLELYDISFLQLTAVFLEK